MPNVLTDAKRAQERAAERAAGGHEDPTFSIIIPTMGRPTLGRAVASVQSQLLPKDEIIITCKTGDRHGATGHWGRNRGIAKATGSHLLFCDDDDAFLPDALHTIRQWAREHPGRIGLFRRQFNARVGLQWRVEGFQPGNLQAMCMCIPNVPGKVPRWREEADDPDQRLPTWSDVMFAELSQTLQGQPCIFVDVVVGHERPESNPLLRLRYRLAPRARLRELLGRK